MNKATILTVIFLAVLAAGALLVQQEMKTATERPAVQRQLSHSRLTQLAAALTAYREAHKTWPDTTAQLLRAAHLPPTATLVRGAGTYRYRKPAEGAAPEAIVVWSDRPHDGVKAGEPWGGEGQHAERDVPPVAYVITADAQVRELAPDDWSRRIPLPASSAPAPVADPPAAGGPVPGTPAPSVPPGAPAAPAVEPVR